VARTDRVPTAYRQSLSPNSYDDANNNNNNNSNNNNRKHGTLTSHRPQLCRWIICRSARRRAGCSRAIRHSCDRTNWDGHRRSRERERERRGLRDYLSRETTPCNEQTNSICSSTPVYVLGDLHGNYKGSFVRSLVEFSNVETICSNVRTDLSIFARAFWVTTIENSQTDEQTTTHSSRYS
jgi:hypothetical protein